MRRAALLLLLAAAGCARGPAAGEGLRVVATVSPITNIIENVGGDRVALTGLVPEGVNSHTFEPSPSDARLLAEARILFANGLNLEEPTLKLARANMRAETRIVELAGGALTEAEWVFDFSFPRSEGNPNPHLWTNPPYAKRFSEIVRDELSRADPAGAARFSRNQARLVERIDALDAAIRAATATVPPERRKLLTYHDSFPYFAREYGWTVVGAIQPADFSEPSPREVAALIDQVRRERVPAIFGSEVFPSPVLEQIARETGARYVADLRDDDLPGDPSDPEHSYVGLMRFNLVTIVEALGGNASELKGLDVGNVAGGGARYAR